MTEVRSAETRLPPTLGAEALEEERSAGAGVRVLDVRTPGEYESVHIRGSYNVPLDALGEHATELRERIDGPLVLVCQSGARARRAEALLRAAGLREVHVLDGGLNAWLGAELPVERGPERLSLERQVRIGAGALALLGGLLALAVHPLFALLPIFVGAGLVFAGVTDFCGMAVLLSKLPYNRPGRCDVEGMVEALKRGTPPEGAGGSPAAGAPGHPRPTAA